MSYDAIFWSPGTTLEEVEAQVISKAYQFYRGNKSATARSLGIAIRTLDDKLVKLKLDEEARNATAEERKIAAARRLRQARGLEPADAWQATANGGTQAEAGLGEESVAVAASQRSVPMPQRKEIQDVPSSRHANGNTRGTRR